MAYKQPRPKVEFNIPELELIKIAVTNVRGDIWNSIKGNIRNQEFGNITEVYGKFIENKNPLTKEGQCNIILEKINNFEIKVKEQIYGEQR